MLCSRSECAWAYELPCTLGEGAVGMARGAFGCCVGVDKCVLEGYAHCAIGADGWAKAPVMRVGLEYAKGV